MPVTKEKVQLPGVSCSPLSPLPQGLMEGGGPGTPPTYITLDSMQVQGSSFGVKLQAYDAKTSNVRSMGSLASFHEKRNGRQVEVQFTMGIVGFTSSQRKDKKQIQDAIEERMAQLRKIVQDDDPLPDLEVQEVTKKEKTEKHKKDAEHTPSIQPNCSTAAFDAGQLSLLQSYMKQSGGVVGMPF